LPDQLDADQGRGLFLMHQCFDDIRWSRRGNRVQLASRRRRLMQTPISGEDTPDLSVPV
jgi:serine/threonine-protein kinase RsbW/non-specific serine/threonine protein kinase